MKTPNSMRIPDGAAAFAGASGSYLNRLDGLLVRSIERQKASDVLQRHLPRLLAAAEKLCERLYGFARSGIDPAALDIWIGVGRIDFGPDGLRDYGPGDRFIGNAYRLCAFVARVELYSQDPRRMGVESADEIRRVDACLMNIRSVLADAEINGHPRDEGWRDHLVSLENQAAIGGLMSADDRGAALLDPGRFSDIVRIDPEGRGDARRILSVARFFADIAGEKDFRVTRMRMLVVVLIDLVEVLSPGRVDRLSAETALRWLREVGRRAGGPDAKCFFAGLGDTRDRLEEVARSGERPAIPRRRDGGELSGNVDL